MHQQRGYVTILLLLIGVVVLAMLYLYDSPLKQVVQKDGSTTTEAQAAIQAAKDARALLEAKSAAQMQLAE